MPWDEFGAPDDEAEETPPPQRRLVGCLLFAAYLLLYAGCILIVGVVFGLPVVYGLACILAGQALAISAWAVHRVRRRRDAGGR